jgi:predicted amidohydrolase YtcJ
MPTTPEPQRSRIGIVAAVCATTLVFIAIAVAVHRGRTGVVADPAATIFVNGRIYTSNPAQPWAEAIAIRGNKIVAVGAAKDVLAWRGPQTNVIDLAGRMAMPGIIDTHTHFVEGSTILAGVSVAGLPSIDAVKAHLVDFAKSHPGDGWIMGGGWDYGSYWPGGLPTKALLDEIFPNRPVVLISSDGHSAWANSIALARAKITRDTPNPDTPELHGIIVHDPKTHEPTGVLEEGAQYLVNAAFDDDTLLQDLREGMTAANQQGITGVINATGDEHEVELYSKLHDRGELTVRMTTSWSNGVGSRHTLSDKELAGLEAARTKYKGNWVRFGAVKFFSDGVVETHTAGMLAPYANATTPGEKGKLLYSPDELKRDYLILDQHGFQVMTHSVGDAAVREVLDAYEAVEKQDGPRDRRWRIEHMEVVAAQDRPRLAQLQILAAFQPWCCASLDEPWGAGVGAERMADGIPWHDVVSAGATLIMGSDWPVEPLNPFVIMQTGVTRQTPDGQPAGGFFPKQALTLDEMLPGYTRNAAYAEFMEDRLGQLKPGYLADVIVLSQDLYKIPANTIGKTQAVLTMVDGKIVHRDGL